MKAGGAAHAHVAARPAEDPPLILQLGALKLGDPKSAASLTALKSILRLIGTQYHSEDPYFQIVTISINLHSFTGSVTWSPSATSSPYPPPQRSSSDITIDSPCSIHGSEEDRFARSGREGGRGRLRSAAVSASAALAASPSSLSSSRGGRFVIVSLLYSWNDEQMMRRRRSGKKKKNH